MSIADSIFSMRVANALPPNSGMNGRHSRQSSLSIQSASGIRASPTIGLSVHVLLIFLVHEELPPRSGSRHGRLSVVRHVSDSCQAVFGHNQLKFVFSKKATKIDKIFTVDMTLCSKCQINGQFLWPS